MKSPLRWNGGKGNRLELIGNLLAGFPCAQYSYIEPCVGGGSVYYAFGHQFRARYIGDYNKELVNLYQIMQTDCTGLMAELTDSQWWYRGHLDAYSNNHFKWLRSLPFIDPVQRAARYLYVNRCSINGLMRVNQEGRINAAPGDVKYRIDYANLLECAAALQGTKIFRSNAIAVVRQAAQLPGKIFLYLDPPYHDVNHKTKYTGFTPGSFSPADQAELATALLASGHPFIYSNKATPLITGLFAGVPQFEHRLVYSTGPKECRGVVEKELWVYRL